MWEEEGEDSVWGKGRACRVWPAGTNLFVFFSSSAMSPHDQKVHEFTKYVIRLPSDKFTSILEWPSSI